MAKGRTQGSILSDKNFDVHGPSQEQNNGATQGAMGTEAEVYP
jgi:hypothetical protein